MVAMTSMMVGCTSDFLEQDPLSFYEPAATYSTEAGLQAALAQCDKQLKTYRIDGNWNNVGIFTNYLMSDVGMYAKTDMGGGFQDNFDAVSHRPLVWLAVAMPTICSASGIRASVW